MRKKTPVLFLVGLIVVCIATAFTGVGRSAAQAAASPTQPDIVGIRAGMAPQQVYDLLRAYNPRLTISMGQTTIPALASKPITVFMSIGEPNPSLAPEIITVAFTMPPNKQQVWGVTRQLQYNLEAQEPLAANVVAGLKQKYGMPWPGTSTTDFYWAFDEQGTPKDETPVQRTASCRSWNEMVNAVPIARTDSATYNVGDIEAPANLTPGNPCSSLVTVRAYVPEGSRHDTVKRINVTMVDAPLLMASRKAYDAVMSKAAAAKENQKQQQLDQRGTPRF